MFGLHVLLEEVHDHKPDHRDAVGDDVVSVLRLHRVDRTVLALEVDAHV